MQIIVYVHLCEYDIEVNPSDTIWALKCKIYSESLGGPSKGLLPPDDQTLVLYSSGRKLKDCGKTIEFYGIHEESTIKCKLVRYRVEYGFRRLLDAFRKKERTSLELGVDNQTMSLCTCIKHLCWHAHELGVLSLTGKRVFFIHHSYHVHLL
jgi:hypothetical protein